MIKVNLLRDVGGGGAAASSSGEGSAGITMDMGTAQGAEGGAGYNDLIVKLILLGLCFLLTFLYRNYQIGQKEAEMLALQNNLNQLTEKLKEYEPGLKDIEKFQEEKRKL